MPKILALVLCSAVAIIALLVSFRLLRRNWLMGWLRGSAGLLILTLACASLLLILQLTTYAPANRDSTLITVEVSKRSSSLGESAKSVTLTDASGTRYDLALEGDLINLEIAWIRWQPWIELFGSDSVYQLRRVRGQFMTLEQERSFGEGWITVTRPNQGFLERAAEAVWGGQVPLALAKLERQQALYIPLQHGALYSVSQGAGQLKVSALNETAQRQLQTTPRE